MSLAAEREHHHAGEREEEGGGGANGDPLPEEERRKEDDHHRPEEIEDACLLRGQLRKPVVVEPRVKEDPEKAQPRHRRIAAHIIGTKHAPAAAHELHDDEKERARETAHKERLIRRYFHEKALHQCRRRRPHENGTDRIEIDTPLHRHYSFMHKMISSYFSHHPLYSFSKAKSFNHSHASGIQKKGFRSLGSLCVSNGADYRT